MFTVSRDTEITPLLMCDYIKIHNQRAAKLDVLQIHRIAVKPGQDPDQPVMQGNNK